MSEKGNRTLLLKRFEAAETARKIASLEAVIRDFEALAAAISQQIATEEDRSKVRDPRRANYSMVAKSSAARRSKLIISLVDLRSKLEVAKREHVDVASEVRNLELALGVTSENANLAQIKHAKAPSRPL
jgi:flagellar FliJ protein